MGGITRAVLLLFLLEVVAGQSQDWRMCHSANIEYIFLAELRNFGDAKVRCEQLYSRAHLATPRSIYQEECIQQVYAGGGGSSNFWIGLEQHSENTSDNFYVDTGEIATYTNWLPGQPNSSTSGDRCVTLTTRDGVYGWSEDGCSSLRYAICQRPGIVWHECPGESVYYTLDKRFRKFSDARDICKSLHTGAHLATPKNAEQSECVHRRRTTAINIESAWIGLELNTWTSPAGYSYNYIDGSGTVTPFTYTNWSVGQPNNLGGSQRCVRIIGRGGINGWDDLDCYYELPPICEISQTFNSASLGDGKRIPTSSSTTMLKETSKNPASSDSSVSTVNAFILLGGILFGMVGMFVAVILVRQRKRRRVAKQQQEPFSDTTRFLSGSNITTTTYQVSFPSEEEGTQSSDFPTPESYSDAAGVYHAVLPGIEFTSKTPISHDPNVF